MDMHAGYHWTIRQTPDGWRWSLFDPTGGAPLVSGDAPSRPVAAALVIRAIARGVTAELQPEQAAA